MVSAATTWVCDTEIECLARVLIAEHGTYAAPAAVERVNDMIDRHDCERRDVWARVVHAIHDQQRLHRGGADAAYCRRETAQIAAMMH
jgi:hypothetical protein